MKGGTPKASLLLCALVLAGLLAGGAWAGVGKNQANHSKLITEPIETYRYDRATRCNGGKLPAGTRALIRWLDRRLPGSYWGAHRCEKWSTGSFSVHSEGRAVDWAIDARKPRLRRQAMKLIRERLLAPDRRGNENALARRMGVQGIIYDCRSWFSHSGGLGPYSYCFTRNGRRKKGIDPTQAHIDHIHIELNKPGSRKKTSYWRSGLR